MARKKMYSEPLMRISADIPGSLRDVVTAVVDDLNDNHLKIRKVSTTEAVIALILLAKEHPEQYRDILIKG